MQQFHKARKIIHSLHHNKLRKKGDNWIHGLYFCTKYKYFDNRKKCYVGATRVKLGPSKFHVKIYFLHNTFIITDNKIIVQTFRPDEWILVDNNAITIHDSKEYTKEDEFNLRMNNELEINYEEVNAVREYMRSNKKLHNRIFEVYMHGINQVITYG